jgi:hypothetical protein
LIHPFLKRGRRDKENEERKKERKRENRKLK